MLYFCGDTHFNIDISKLNMKSFPEQKHLTKNDYVIVCGDFGLLFDHKESGLTVPSNPKDTCWSKEELYWYNWYNERNFTTLWVDGNHESFSRLETYPITEWNGGKVQKISDSIIHLMRGQVYTIDGVTLFTMGGAASVDRGPQIGRPEDEGKIWWPQEDITDADMREANYNLSQVGNKVDIIVTHDVPMDVRMQMGYYSNDLNAQKLQLIKDTVDYKAWFAGHWHRYSQYGKIQILYNQVVKYNNDGSWTKVTQNI